jgi:hypothetical protein
MMLVKGIPSGAGIEGVTEMGWDRGRYYSRSVRVNGRVQRQYIGGGEIGLLAAAADADRRAMRAEKSCAWESEKIQLEALDAELEVLDEVAGLLTHAAFVAAGFHQHNRQWRRKRVRPDQNEPDCSNEPRGVP